MPKCAAPCDSSGASRTNGSPSSAGASWRAAFSGCALTEVPDCGHLMQEDAPEAVVSAAFAFFG
jgi:pimeloyl-ACP methyl ester carboxylesterase